MKEEKKITRTDEIIGVRRDYNKKLDKWYEAPKYKKTQYIVRSGRKLVK